MSYSIQYSVRAAEEIKKLEPEVAINIVKVLERIRTRPYAFVQKVVCTAYYRLKIGQYRVIMDIIDKELIILVIQTGHRKNVYQKK